MDILITILIISTVVITTTFLLLFQYKDFFYDLLAKLQKHSFPVKKGHEADAVIKKFKRQIKSAENKGDDQSAQKLTHEYQSYLNAWEAQYSLRKLPLIIKITLQ